MKILFLSPIYPFVSYSGSQYRALYLLRHLASHHEVDVICFDQKSDKSESSYFDMTLLKSYRILYRPKHTLCTLLKNIPHPLPYHAYLVRTKEMRDAINNFLDSAKYDVIFVNKSDILSLLLDHPKLHKAKLILDQIAAEPDVWSNLIRNDPRWYIRVYSRLNYIKVQHFIRLVYPMLSLVISISERDQTITSEYYSDSNIIVIPQGVDLEYYFPEYTPDFDHKRLLFSGSNATRNIDALQYYIKKIHPYVTQKCPNIKLLWIGNVKDRDISFLNKNLNISFTGFVPHTPPYFNMGMIYIAPFRMGEGMKTKIIEAMAMEKVVVSTTIGVQGINVKGLPFVKVTDDPKEFAAYILEFLDDPQRTINLGKKARQYVQENFSWEKLIKPLDEFLTKL